MVKISKNQKRVNCNKSPISSVTTTLPLLAYIHDTKTALIHVN